MFLRMWGLNVRKGGVYQISQLRIISRSNFYKIIPSIPPSIVPS